MKSIEVSDEAFERIGFAANIAGISIAVAVDRMVKTSTAQANPPARERSTPRSDKDEIAVYVVYRNQKVSGFLDLESERLSITEAPRAELIDTYRTPSNAAVAIVRILNPDRQHPETNGWRFFNGPDDKPIDRHRRRRP